jgi:methionine aminopeptidase
MDSHSQFNLIILKKLAEHHKQLMRMIAEKFADLNSSFNSDKDIYDFITGYYNKNNLVKAFPVGISINQVVAHNSYHPMNLTKLKPNDIVKIDFGFIEHGNIIDSARTFVYKPENSTIKIKAIDDAKIITKKIEDYIRKEIESKGSVNVQKISILTNALIVQCGYDSLGLIGGHSIEYNKVHGKKLILNKPLNLLPETAKNFIDKDWTLGNNEMFAIEIYLPEIKASGELIQSTTIPITHYELNQIEPNNLTPQEPQELTIYESLKNITKGLAYEHFIHDQFDKKIINELVRKNFIIKHFALEFKSNDKNKKIKYIQYEDCFLIQNNQVINFLD